uniref:Uncharacterized protein n=1 Tax=Arundo donax TaxID=35708 RepID=A0A0A9CQL1_ARUDO
MCGGWKGRPHCRAFSWGKLASVWRKVVASLACLLVCDVRGLYVGVVVSCLELAS